MVKRIQINVSDKAFYSLILVGVLLIVGSVYAYNSGVNNPSVFGHSGDEIEVTHSFCNEITGHDCGYDETEGGIVGDVSWLPYANTVCETVEFEQSNGDEVRTVMGTKECLCPAKDAIWSQTYSDQICSCEGDPDLIVSPIGTKITSRNLYHVGNFATFECVTNYDYAHWTRIDSLCAIANCIRTDGGK